MKYILITGGVISGLGKGVAITSLGHLLQLRGLTVTYIKMDPYLNVDAGTLSPYEHSEVFVLDDGTETDLDLGNCERFLDIKLTGDNSITMGKVYQNVIAKEREGEYLGKTVQVIPHVVDEINEMIKKVAHDPKLPWMESICLLELGGTVGDIEGMAFLEALRRLKRAHYNEVCHIHVTLVPIVNEQKSKPTQHSYKELRRAGLTPDFIFCRCDELVNQDVKQKISDFCNMDFNRVISVHNVKNVHSVPALLEEQKVSTKVLKHLKMLNQQNDFVPDHMQLKPSPFLTIKEYPDQVTIGIVGKYSKLTDAYLSLYKALFHASQAVGVGLNIELIDSEKIGDGKLLFTNGIIVPGGFGSRGTNGKIEACRYARENKVPFLGICYGFQLAVIEHFRNVQNNRNVDTEEITGNPDDLITNMYRDKDLGGTMLKGLHNFTVKKGTKLHSIYGKTTIQERCRHRYEVNRNWIDDGRVYGNFIWTCSTESEEKAFIFTPEEEIDHFGRSITPPVPENPNERAIAFELTDHPFYIGVQYHPELLSRFVRPLPLFVEFIKASIPTIEEHTPQD